MTQTQDPAPAGPERLTPSDVNRLLLEFLMYMGRAILLLYPVYLTGSLGLSISWVLLSLLVWNLWEKNRKHKDVRIDTAIDFLENEFHVIKNEMKTLNMPAWVQFTDVEKAAWINKILHQAWPFFGVFMDKLLKESIQKSLQASSPHLKTFKFTKVHFGQKAPVITGIRVYTHEVDKREVILDLNIVYTGDLTINADVKSLSVGLKDLQLQGMLRVILDPLIGQAPLVGGITMFFFRRPILHLNWTGVTNLLDSPAFRPFSETAILDVIASLMVLPNRLCFPLVDQVNMDQMRFPLPRGVVRVHVLEAQDLVAMDKVMMGLAKGKSDPYAILRVGNKRIQTKTIKETLNPRWNEVYEFVVHEAPGQNLELEVYDEDTDKDDFLGRFSLDFGEVKKEKVIDKWFTLQDIPSGKVHMKLQWLSLQTDKNLLKEATNGCACAMLAIRLDSASKLPKDQSEFSQPDKPGKQAKDSKLTRRQTNPNSYVKFSVDQQSQKSKIVYNSRDPVFEEFFTFFVHNVESQVLNIQVMVPEKKTSLGMLTLPLSRLLNASDFTLDQRFTLERSGANSQLKMKAILRVLKLEKPEPKVENPPAAKLQRGAQAKAQQVQPKPSQPQPQPETQAQPPAQSSQPVLNVPASTQPQGPTATVNPPASDSSSRALQTASVPHYRRDSFLTIDGRRSRPTTPSRIRRYDSHSILSDNSIASSRLDLAESTPYPEALLNHQGSFGQIQLTIRFATLRNKLIVTVNGCRGLFQCSDSGSDTYVRIYLLPDQKWKNRMRTQVKRKTVEPVFEEKFEFSVPLEDAKCRMLDVSVKNNRMFHTRERKEIGMVLIDLSKMDLVKGSIEWYELSLPGLKKNEGQFST